MDKLPFELLRHIAGYCDHADIPTFRLLTRNCADVGIEYLVPPHFQITAYRAEDDIECLREIGLDPLTRRAIESITLNVTAMKEYGRKPIDLWNWQNPDPPVPIRWKTDHFTYYSLARKQADFDFLGPESTLYVARCLRSLPNLEAVKLTFLTPPYGHFDDHPQQDCDFTHCEVSLTKSREAIRGLLRILNRATARPPGVRRFGPEVPPSFRRPSTENDDAAPASGHSTRSSSPLLSDASNTGTSPPSSLDVPSSFTPAVLAPKDLDGSDPDFGTNTGLRLKSLTIDYVPMDLFHPKADNPWMECTSMLQRLERLDLAIEFGTVCRARWRARSEFGLGTVLRMAKQLKSLSLSFSSEELSGYASHVFSFNAICDSDPNLPYLVFENLTDFALCGVQVDEEELRNFLVCHARTLERVRLGGPKQTRSDKIRGGHIALTDGSLHTLLSLLRGRMPKLQRFHIEGLLRGFIMTNATLPEVDDYVRAAEQHGDDAAIAEAHEVRDDMRLWLRSHTLMHPEFRSEQYRFVPIDDENWSPASAERRGPSEPRCGSVLNGGFTSAKFEAFVLGHINWYPGFFLPRTD